MTMPQNLIDLFSVPDQEDALSIAQAGALRRQVPVLHTLLGVNAVSVAWTHYGIAPHWLTILPLCLLLTVCATRIVAWRRRAQEGLDGPEAVRRLRGTNRLSAIMGLAFAGWAVALTRYGDPATNMHVLFFLTITMIACVFCLMHLRSAMLIIGSIALPLTLYFIFAQHDVVRATALNYAGVVLVMMFMQSICYNDFCRLVRLGDENRTLAHTDSLTKLPNRRSFFAELRGRIRLAETGSGTFAIGMIDLDGFKPVNDTFGHRTGDAVLREVGRRLEEAMAGIGWVGRLGGDEFGLILDGEPDLDALGKTLCASLRRPYLLPEARAQIGASIGFARFTPDAPSAETLIERADCALYHAKSHRRGTAVCFAMEHEDRQRRHAAIEQALRCADIESEFSLVYQPIVDLDQGRVEAYEALARWTSPILGPVSPADFIPVAERAGLVQDLTRGLLRKALEEMRAWPAEIGLSFNLSAQDIASPESLATLSALILGCGVAPGRLTLEVTETGLMRDLADAEQALRALREFGVRIALDDFGTGYSSLSYVHRLPIDRIKIDRGFVTAIGTDPASINIVRSIIDLGRNLQLRCVVEGVETPEQLLLLRSIGCRLMQGYLFQRPAEPGELAAARVALASELPRLTTSLSAAA